MILIQIRGTCTARATSSPQIPKGKKTVLFCCLDIMQSSQRFLICCEINNRPTPPLRAASFCTSKLQDWFIFLVVVPALSYLPHTSAISSCLSFLSPSCLINPPGRHLCRGRWIIDAGPSSKRRGNSGKMYRGEQVQGETEHFPPLVCVGKDGWMKGWKEKEPDVLGIMSSGAFRLETSGLTLRGCSLGQNQP